MEKIFLNKEFSKELHSLGEYRPKECYDNVFRNLHKINHDNLKIMFAYVSVLDLENIYTRHACFYLDGMAIDPTMISVLKDSVEDYDTKYIPIKIMTANEYYKLGSQDGRSDLMKVLREIERDMSNKLKDNGITLIG